MDKIVLKSNRGDVMEIEFVLPKSNPDGSIETMIKGLQKAGAFKDL